jgi:signal transduction histidine kinase/ligand-binding sensor domain-containing protein
LVAFTTSWFWLAHTFDAPQNPFVFTRWPFRRFLLPFLAACHSTWRGCVGWLIFATVFGPIEVGQATNLNSPNFFLRIWKTDDGLPDNAVTSVVQTHDGYLWLATYGGLARFDGVRFTIFNNANTPELQSDRITSLFEDKKNILWIGHERGDLTSYHDGKFEAQNFHERGMRRKIAALGSDEAGDIWMLNDEGTMVRARDGASCALPNTDGGVQLTQASPRNLWLASGGQLAMIKNGAFSTDNTPNEGYVQGVCGSHDGKLWIVCNDRVRKWDKDAWVEDRGTNPCPTAISTMIETASGCLAMGTGNNGLYLLFPDSTVIHYSQANGLPHDWVRCIQEDHEGTIWLGVGSGGLVAVQPSKIMTLNPPDHWEGNVVLSTTATHDGAIWVGTEGAGLYRYLNGSWVEYGRNSGFSNIFVWSVAEDHQGQLWAGTWGSGMYVKQGEHFVTPPGLENINVPMPALLHAHDGSTWIGTASGLIHYTRGIVRWYGEKEGVKVPDIRAIAEDKQGTIWFGMLGGGLGCLRDGKTKQFSKQDGLSSDYVQCLHLDEDGTLWIGTYGNGLCRYQDGKFARISIENGLLNNFICDIEGDKLGNFWISSHKGIFRVPRHELIDFADGAINYIHCLSYGKGEGMPSMECSGGLQPASAQTADGRLWFPTSQGLAVVNPEESRNNHKQPPVAIEDIMANGHILTQNPHPDQLLEFDPGLQRFEFHYTGLSFQAPEKIQFQYRLEGWEPDWVAAGTKRMAEYSYIPPGTYTFFVRARNDDGYWSGDGVSFRFRMLPQFWQTWWFRVIELLAGVGLVGGSVLFITRQRMRRKLDRVQRQQTLERERTRIAKDIHDHLGANLTRISLLSQSAHCELDNPEQVSTQLNRIFDTTRELTRSLDEIVWAVNPHHDTLDSLASYLGNFAQEFLVPINIRCRLDMPMHLPQWPITAEVRHNVFLAFKETLNNVAKHSAATEVTVLLVTEPRGFTLTVRDNGRGFAAAITSNTPQSGRLVRGNGLKNMRQRLEKLGGICTIESSSGNGTQITFFVQVQHD